MAQGNNKEYMRNPENYLITHEINRNPGPGYAVAAGAAIPIPSPGPSNIDLVPPPGVGPAGVVLIQNYDTRSHGFGAKPIRAYWLPAGYNATNTITLGNAANYFFTSDLSGCLFAVYTNALGVLTVEHTNAHDVAAPIMVRLGIVNGMVANGPIRVLSPIPWPAGWAALHAGSHFVHYTGNAWVIGGRVGAVAPGGWRFRYKLSTAPGAAPVL